MNEKRTLMNRKPVFFRDARTVLNMQSGFKAKQLCDGPTFSMGDACVYSCSFCYVPDILRKAAWHDSENHRGIVVRRAAAVEILKGQLRGLKAEARDAAMVVYSSPLVDCAANMELAKETAQASAMILKETKWHIRLLSKSSLLRFIPAETMKAGASATDVHDRMIFGLSTGTLDDRLAASFEEGCPTVSQRLKALHWLQGQGFRTFGMICPTLPQRDHAAFANSMTEALRIDAWKFEEVWAEVINVRGDSLDRTANCLLTAGYEWEGLELRRLASDKAAWENSARATFEALRKVIGPTKLRWLHYINKANEGYWSTQPGVVML